MGGVPVKIRSDALAYISRYTSEKQKGDWCGCVGGVVVCCDCGLLDGIDCGETRRVYGGGC